ncbi:MAG: ATP-dependent Clp protease proteolytic subunit [Paludibacteraceae bacterium]|nr:ATP-dependent Clp protease proteolytic subunit [Paludibacteraceae bacterium]
MKHSLIMGPRMAQPTAAVPKFWNVASVSDDEGEITLYGDVMSSQPVDWWTGEPVPGLFITPEGFMDDLATVKDKSKITVKLNSCGGDLYTGIAIHNALKELAGEVNVVVEGIAASAASVIMCAGDTVTVFPGSLIMIHGVSVMLWDALNIQDMKLLMKGMDASERAVAEIYNAKTGIDTETLRSMMTKETWLTGREAMEKGFADALKEDGKDPEMSLSTDKKVLFVNGISHNIEGMRNIPGTIPFSQNTPPAAKPGVNKKPTATAATKEGGTKPMTMEELRANHPDLVSAIEEEARNSVQSQNAEAVNAERARIEAIDSIAASIPDQALVNDAKYGENPCTAQELCFRVMQKSAAAGQQFLAAFKQDGEASGANGVGAAPNGGAAVSQQEQDAADMQAVLAAYNKTKGGTK